MDRLTTKLEDGRVVLKDDFAYVMNTKHGAFIEGKAVDKLAEYEDSEEQGLLLRLPCKVGDTVWTRKFPTRIDEEDGTEWTICDIKRATVVPTKFNLFMLAKWGDLYFLTKEEAEQKLASMQKGE